MPKRQRTHPTTHLLPDSLDAGGTMSSASLDTFPTEILDLVADSLEVHDLGALRLAGRSVASKVSNGRNFRKYFRKKTITLRVEYLQNLNKLLQSNGLACSLEDATVTSTVSPDVPDAALVETLLSRAFASLKESGRGLQSLNLVIVRDQDSLNSDPSKNMKKRNPTAVRQNVFRAVILALQETGLSVRKLNLFRDKPGDSISIEWIREMPDLGRLASSLKEVKSFSVSLSTNPGSSQDTNNPERPASAPEENITAFIRLLHSMQSLETLDLLWYKTRPLSDTPEAFFLDTYYSSIASLKLKTCTLRGICAAEASLKLFLQQTPAKRITLQEIHLHNGTFTPIIDVLTRADDRFEYFHLDDLFEDALRSKKMVYFKIPGRPKFPVMRGGVGPSEIEREGDEVTRKLEYTFASGRPLGSGANLDWSSQSMRLFGNPPRAV